MAENKCTGNCMNCSVIQRQFCAAQLAFTNMKMMEQLQNEVKVLSEKVEAMQNNEGLLFSPMQDVSDSSE